MHRRGGDHIVVRPPRTDGLSALLAAPDPHHAIHSSADQFLVQQAHRHPLVRRGRAAPQTRDPQAGVADIVDADDIAPPLGDVQVPLAGAPQELGDAAAGLVGCAAPAVILAPLSLLGFGAGGIAAGSVAAGMQAGVGNVVAGSVFAFMQSAAAGGTAATAVAAGSGIVGSVAGVGAAAAAYLRG